MGTITAFESITLDGVTQAPGRADEDERNGFDHGGWATGFDDETMMRFSGENMAGTEALLFGRRTDEDLEKAYSNPADQVKRLHTLLELPRMTRPRAPRLASKQAQKRLDAEEVAQLVAAHRAGTGVKELARRFGIHRGTVSDILRREGALRSPGIGPDDVDEVVRLYEEGWSLA